MGRDQRVDEYLAAAPEFARPILAELRTRIHGALPGVEEGIKWGMPHFMLGGKNVAGIAAFKAHCALVIHGAQQRGEGMGAFGRITSIDDLPPDAELCAALTEARARIVDGKPAPKRRATAKPDLPVPAQLEAALAGDARAKAGFDALAPSYRREYIEWIASAKREDTRARRLATALEWLAEGKRRNWKYERG